MDREQMERVILWAAEACTVRSDGSWEADEGIVVRPDGRTAVVVGRDGNSSVARSPRELFDLVKKALPRKIDGECKAIA